MERAGGTLIAVIFVALSAISVNAQTTAPTRSVHFAFTDCWGNPVPGATVLINSIEPISNWRRLSYPAESEVRLSQGRYHIFVDPTGFFRSSLVIELSDADLDVRTCLTLAPIEGTAPLRADLNVTATAALTGKKNDLWARLVGLYSGAIITAPPVKQGRFSFHGLQPGRYLLLLFDAADLKAQQQIDVHVPSTSVTIP